MTSTQVRSQGVLGRIDSLAEQVEQVETQLKCFTVVMASAGVRVCVCSSDAYTRYGLQALRANELAAIPARVDALTQEVERLMKREDVHQMAFSELMHEKETLLSKLDAVQNGLA